MGITALHKVRKFAFMVLAVLIPSLTFAQSYTLKGVVNDDNGAPLAGTTIIKGTTGEGTISGADGSFELSVKKGDVLAFSFIGYLDNEITISGQSNLSVKMVANASKLGDVVVVGYGRMRRADVTAAITSVDVDELKTVATSDPMAALQGRVSGVNIQKTSGLAGSGVAVKIRGVSTFGNSEPLYIIDGFPGNISSVSPSDIESLQILKDGAASAIYGSEAANGVVIVTTKSGKKGAVKIEFNAYVSANQIASQFDLLDSKGFQKVQTAIFENDGKKAPKYATEPAKYNTDWQDEVFRTGFSQNYSINVSGGTENINVAAGANYTDDMGVAIGNRYNRKDAYVKAQLTKNCFVFDAKMSYMGSDRSVPTYNIKDLYMIAPLVSVYADPDFVKDPTTKYGLTSDYGVGGVNNPIADHENRTDDRKTQRVTAQASITINFTDWLSLRSGYSFSSTNYRGTTHGAPYVSNSQQPNLYASNSDYRTQNMKQVVTNALTFDKKFNKHSLNIMLGMQADMTDYNEVYADVTGKTTIYGVKDGKLTEETVPAGFADTSFPTINAGEGGTYTASGYYNEYNRLSYFGRVNYNYDNKYLVQATIRRDASSYFGKNNRWGTFPSVAVGWRITQENFFPKNTAVDDLKIRASYGQIGNEAALSPYSYETLMYTSSNMWGAYVQGGNPWIGMFAPNVENGDLKWETTESINAGIDYAFFKSRLTGSFNWYQTTTKNLLITKEVPPSSAVNSPIMNVGTIRNRGIEFEARWAETRGDWDYNIGLIVSTTKNKVLKLSSPDQTLVGKGLKYGDAHFPNATREGGSIGEYFLYKTDGIFQTNAEAANYKYTWVDEQGKTQEKPIQPKAKAGDLKFVDVNNDGKIDANDKESMGSGIPKAEVSLSLGFGWKGIDFSALLGSGWGHKLYNGNRYLYEGMESTSNMFASTLNAWTPENPGSSMPRAILADPNGNTLESDRFLENGNFIRLRQVQIGYTLPSRMTKKAYIDRVRFYVSAENLWTWTNYSGIDPEFGVTSSDPRYGILSTGVDNLIYPFTKSYIFGVQISF
ncbi:MAG: TonB-dependent receptor [Rikenellaceae bacterium]